MARLVIIVSQYGLLFYEGRFKKILNQMGKIHHQFFLHCLVKRRNLYTTRLYEEGRRSLLAIDVKDANAD